MDNCEHLIEACAKLADTLLHTAPNLKILASSREALGVNGEQAWHVPSLSIPDLKRLPTIEQLSQYEAVRLFIDRALLVQPHFAVTNDNAPAVAQICSRLDGIPLAIELAVARVKVLKAEQIAERLDDRFRLLTGGSRTALPRQQTLRALIDWSYDLLSENEKLFIRRLSIFMGGWTLESAEQVCSGDSIHAEDILDLLTHLVDKSLVVIDEESSQLRYRMLETVRQYAREKLVESGEGEKLRTQHLAYFLKFAEEAEPHLSRAEQIEWLDRLDLDNDNLQTALEWAIETEQNDIPDAELRLVNALWYFWEIRGNVLAYAWFTRALAKIREPLPTVSRARALGRAGYFAQFLGKIKESSKLIEESLVLCQELEDEPGLAFALFRKGVLSYGYLDEIDIGRSLCEASFNLYRKLNDKWGLAWALVGLGECARERQLTSESALQYFEDCLSYAQESGNRRMIWSACVHRADLAIGIGDFSTAQLLFEKSLSLGMELKDKSGRIASLYYLAYLAMGRGDFWQSEKIISESLSIAQDLGQKDYIVSIFGVKGQMARYQNNYIEATQIQTESLTLAREIDEIGIDVCKPLQLLGELQRLQNKYASARLFLHEAITLAKRVHERQRVAYCLEEFAALGAIQDQAKRAATLFGAAEALREVIHIVLLPIEKIEVDKNIAAARAQLDEASFNAAWAEGRAMKMEDAIEYALNELE